MTLDLEKLSQDMLSHLKAVEMPIFFGFHRFTDSTGHVTWNSAQHPDFREFVAVARKSGAKLLVFHQEQFPSGRIEAILQDVEDAELTRDEKRRYQTQLRKLEGYEGFTCALQLSFVTEGRLFLYEARTEWYDTYHGLLAEIDMALTELEEQEDEEEGPIGGFYSNN